jgi:hypothetical protein
MIADSCRVLLIDAMRHATAVGNLIRWAVIDKRLERESASDDKASAKGEPELECNSHHLPRSGSDSRRSTAPPVGRPDLRPLIGVPRRSERRSRGSGFQVACLDQDELFN